MGKDFGFQSGGVKVTGRGQQVQPSVFTTEQKDYLKAQPGWDWHQMDPKLEPLLALSLALSRSHGSSSSSFFLALFPRRIWEVFYETKEARWREAGVSALLL